MNEEAAFLKAIKKSPKDRTARLVFADWLQERDDPRAAWIRDDDIWQWMKPDAKDPTRKLIASVKMNRGGAHLLARMGPAVVPAILEALRGTKGRTIYPLQQALEGIGPSAEPALPHLLAAAKEPSLHVRAGAVGCAGGLVGSSAEAVGLVLAALDDAEDGVRQTALNALYHAGPAAAPAVPKLVALVLRPEPRALRTALAILANLDALDESLLPQLISILVAGQDGQDLNAIAAALGKMGPPAARAILDTADKLRGGAVWAAAHALECIGRDAVPVLRKALGSPRSETRQFAAAVLSKFSGEQAADTVPGVIEALRSPDRVIRENALRSIHKLGPVAAPALPVLLDIACDEKQQSHDRCQAAHAIGYLGPAAESAVPALIALAGRRESFVPTSVGFALDALGRGPSAVLALLNASRSMGKTEYDWVDQNLNNLFNGTSGDLTNLREVVLRAYREGDSDALAEPARLALAKFTPKSVPAICAFLDDPSVATRVVTVWALRHVATLDAVTALLAALKDKDKLVRTHAARALGKIGLGIPGAAEALHATLKDRSKDVRTAATKSLEQLAPEKR